MPTPRKPRSDKGKKRAWTLVRNVIETVLETPGLSDEDRAAMQFIGKLAKSADARRKFYADPSIK